MAKATGRVGACEHVSFDTGAPGHALRCSACRSSSGGSSNGAGLSDGQLGSVVADMSPSRPVDGGGGSGGGGGSKAAATVPTAPQHDRCGRQSHQGLCSPFRPSRLACMCLTAAAGAGRGAHTQVASSRRGRKVACSATARQRLLENDMDVTVVMCCCASGSDPVPAITFLSTRRKKCSLI